MIDFKEQKQVILNTNVKNFSKDPSTQVGASLFNKDGQLIGIGYNGLPRGFKLNGINQEENLSKLSRDLNLCKNDLTVTLCNGCFKDEILSNQLQLHDIFNIKAVCEKIFSKFNSVDNLNLFYKYYLYEHAERNLISNYVRSEINVNSLSAIVKHIQHPEDIRALITTGIQTIYFETFISNEEMFKVKFPELSLEKMKDIIFKDLLQKEIDYISLNQVTKFYIDSLILGLNCLFLIRNNKKLISVISVKNANDKIKQFFFNFDNATKQTFEIYQNFLKAKEQDFAHATHKAFALHYGPCYQNYCLVLKEDYSLLGFGFDEISEKLLNLYVDNLSVNNFKHSLPVLKSLKIDAVKNCLYEINQRYLANKNFELFVTLSPCEQCSLALLLSGIDKIKVNTIKSSTTNARWEKEHEKIPFLKDFISFI